MDPAVYRKGSLAVIVTPAPQMQTGEILGGHILGAHADMLIHEIVVAMQQRATARDLGKTIHIHPTLNEIVQRAAKAVK